MCGGFHAKFQDSRTNNKKSQRPFQSIGQIRENNSVCILWLAFATIGMYPALLFSVSGLRPDCWTRKYCLCSDQSDVSLLGTLGCPEALIRSGDQER